MPGTRQSSTAQLGRANVGALASAERSERQGALDLHEGICDPAPKPGGCKRWPDRLRLASSAGALVPGRCRATNLCQYCQTLYVVETVEMLTLDAIENAPTCWLVLTAREHLTRADTYDHLRQLRKALRKRWPQIEWFVQVEFQRRGALHLNLLVKGVPVEQLDELRSRAVAQWCSRVDALPRGQWAGAVEDGVGVVRYISKMLAHGLKAEQRPPIGWRGHRTSQTRGYLVRPASVMRKEARRSLTVKRELHKLEDLDAHERELELQLRLRAIDRTRWELVVLAGEDHLDRQTGEVTFVPHGHVYGIGGKEPKLHRVDRTAVIGNLAKWHAHVEAELAKERAAMIAAHSQRGCPQLTLGAGRPGIAAEGHRRRGTRSSRIPIEDPPPT